MNISKLHALKSEGKKIVAITAYDYSTAQMIEQDGYTFAGQTLDGALEGIEKMDKTYRSALRSGNADVAKELDSSGYK